MHHFDWIADGIDINLIGLDVPLDLLPIIPIVRILGGTIDDGFLNCFLVPAFATNLVVKFCDTIIPKGGAKLDLAGNDS